MISAPDRILNKSINNQGRITGLESQLEVLNKQHRSISRELSEVFVSVIANKYPECVREAAHIVNTFAGAAPQSLDFLKLLNDVKNEDCVVTAVDTESMSSDELSAFQQMSNAELFEQVRSDVLDYLNTLPNDSVDILTAFGSDKFFNSVDASDGDAHSDSVENILDARQQSFYEQACRVLKSGGLVVFPPPNQSFIKDKNFEFTSITTSLFQKR